MLWIAHLQKIAPLLTRGNVALSPITSLTSLGTAPWRAAFYYHNIRSPSRRTCDSYWVVEYRWSVLPNQVLILFHLTSHCLFPVLGLQKQSGWCGLRLRGTRGGFSWSALSDLVPFSVAGWKRFQLFHSWVPTSNKIDLARRNLQTLPEIAIWFVWIIIMAIFLDKNVCFFPQKHGTDIAETYQTMLSVQQMEFLEDLWRPGKWRVLRENSPILETWSPFFWQRSWILGWQFNHCHCHEPRIGQLASKLSSSSSRLEQNSILECNFTTCTCWAFKIPSNPPII